MLYENNPTVQPVMMAEDPGRTNIGTAVVGLKGQLYLAAVVETRNKEIRKLMDKRRACRRASRNGERKARQRRAKRFGTMLKAGISNYEELMEYCGKEPEKRLLQISGLGKGSVQEICQKLGLSRIEDY